LVSEAEFLGRDVVSIKDFRRDQLEYIFQKVDQVSRDQRKMGDVLEGKLVAVLFFEASTRTYTSFEVAAHLLGARVSGFSNPAASSVSKGETLHDTVRIFAGYGADCLIVRHSKMGAARFVAEVSDAPVINAGDGSHEHPTQAMVDLYSIRKSFGKIDGLKIGILGDLKYGRTASSLSYALANYDVQISYIAPDALQVRPEVELYLRERGKSTKRESSLKGVAKDLDVLYVTRIQKERIPDPTEFQRLKGMYEVNLELLKDAKPSLKVLHPLPRVDELSSDVDGTNYATYFAQAAVGLPLRMALLSLILGGAA
jgi:aspartate carbamoyltransferase catalytic subunit